MIISAWGFAIFSPTGSKNSKIAAKATLRSASKLAYCHQLSAMVIS
jgi:hypothetical protein